MAESFVYVIRASDGRTKVGVSDRPAVRFSHLRAQFRDRCVLEVIFLGRCSCRSESLHIEHHIKGVLWKFRDRGDWFNVESATAVEVAHRAAAELGYELVPHNLSARRSAGRPSKAGTPVMIRLQRQMLGDLDGWRNGQADLPNQQEAIRRLLETELIERK